MTLKGKVGNLMPSLQPNRAIIRIVGWDDSFTVPMGDLKIGQHVEIRIDSLLTSGAAAGLPHSR
jgi:hypothetical protein